MYILPDGNSEFKIQNSKFKIQNYYFDNSKFTTDERSNGERLLADYPLQGGGKASEGGLIQNYYL